MNLQQQIDRFLDGSPHAVVGASRDRSKYGNKVLRAYLQAGKPVYAINPRVDRVEGLVAYASLERLPERPHGVSVITPPAVSESVIHQAGRLGIKHLWLQPGAESEAALAAAAEYSMNVIAGGPCALVVIGFKDE